ncbi:FAS1-like dehydratase domain-containing protein [Aliiroseovarius sp. PTFE2010]|uniref:FAS1-like dehydratase domain-containing protein n=1 Tax=Aliiroseovarius sp. PTFE2010 TaxID=3417190 RepID=UPI003CEDE3B4
MAENDIDSLKPWLGRTETREDVLTPALIDKFRATFGPHLWDGADDVPLGIHWCLTLDAVPNASLSQDGHAARGGFLPPVPLPARMWAGGDVTHIAPLSIGETITRRSTIADIAAKQGRSGALVFVTIEHEYSSDSRLCIREQQSIVYRDITRPQPAKRTRVELDPSTLKSTLTPDPVLLFRYSALTFNAHRIHYDHIYATETEAYPGLVVHGPLQATLLLNLAASALQDSPRRFAFRGLAPLTLPCELQLHNEGTGGSGAVWCQDQTGMRSFSADYSAN